MSENNKSAMHTETHTEMDPEKNALVAGRGTPRFDLFRVQDVVPTVRALIDAQTVQLETLEKSLTPTWAGLVLPLTEIGEPLGHAWGLVHHLLGVANEDTLRSAEEEIQGEVIAASLRMAQSRPLYQGFKQIKEGPEWDKLDEAQKRIVDSALKSAEDAGIGLEGDDLKRFIAIETEMGELTTKFSNNVLDATKAFSLVLRQEAEMAGLPPSLRGAAAQAARMNAGDDEAMKNATAENGPWRISLDGPILVPFLEHSQRRDLREKIYKAQVTRASTGKQDNQPLIESILKLRREKAKLLGHDNYAALSLSRKMAKTTTPVYKLLDDLRTACKPAAEKEMQELQAYAAKQCGDASLELWHWDIGFYAERLREEKYSFTDEELRPFFALPTVLKGLFSVAQKLFGVSIEAADGQAPVWNGDVGYFKIKDEQGKDLASFFLDPYARPENKRGGAWMDNCLDRKPLPGGGVRLPVAYLVCNQSPPVDGKPSLMTFSEVETLFHEFGHGLQHMLTKVEYPDAAGINNVEWDAVELPSQFMENWCYHKETLLGFARHFESDQALPEELFNKIVAARTYRAGSHFLRQLYFSTLDLRLHEAFESGAGPSIRDMQQDVAKDNTILASLPEDRFLCGFSHIFAGGYAAGYYSYKWAEVLAADAFGAFEEVGLDNDEAVAKVGRRFRDTVLALGGGREPGAVFRDFRGRDPDAQALLRTYGLAA